MRRILYRGGLVHAAVPGATALLCDGPRIAWVGSDEAAEATGAFAGVDRVVDLAGAWVAPAFVDAHVHVVPAGLAMQTFDLSAARSLTDVLDAVQASAAHLPRAALVSATGWDESTWTSGVRRPPTPPELASAAGGRAVYLARADLHSAVASPALLALAGLETADEPVRGEAHHQVRAAVRRMVPLSQRYEAARSFLVAAAQAGVGMVHDCSGPHIGDPADLALVRQAAADTGVDVATYWGESGPGGVRRARQWGAEPAGDVFVDGSVGSHTAALDVPYADAPSNQRGQLHLSPAEVAEHLVAATKVGAQAGFHAIGDAAIAVVLAGFAAAEAVVGLPLLAAARHRIEHLELCGPEQRRAIARFGILACVQPAFDARWGGPSGMYATRVGSQRAAAMNDFAALAADGIGLAFGSDSPVTPVDPWGTVRAAMAPTVREHALSGRAAFAAHTRGGHRAARQDDGGVLRPGADATFAVWGHVGRLVMTTPDGRVAAWSTDPRSGSPGLPDLETTAPRCMATVVRGRTAYDTGVLAAVS
jgi:hypothetical protein